MVGQVTSGVYAISSQLGYLAPRSKIARAPIRLDTAEGCFGGAFTTFGVVLAKRALARPRGVSDDGGDAEARSSWGGYGSGGALRSRPTLSRLENAPRRLSGAKKIGSTKSSGSQETTSSTPGYGPWPTNCACAAPKLATRSRRTWTALDHAAKSWPSGAASSLGAKSPRVKRG
jgi:hypothetical protein